MTFDYLRTILRKAENGNGNSDAEQFFLDFLRSQGMPYQRAIVNPCMQQVDYNMSTVGSTFTRFQDTFNQPAFDLKHVYYFGDFYYNIYCEVYTSGTIDMEVMLRTIDSAAFLPSDYKYESKRFNAVASAYKAEVIRDAFFNCIRLIYGGTAPVGSIRNELMFKGVQIVCK
jgi:hypothetical protein